ncbi:MAG: orotate phosphoribosyltransferase [Flavobacteriales bacterium]
MILNKDSALQVAEFLLQIKAIIIRPKEPFKWASGWKSPVYCDNRKTLSYPLIRTYIRQQLTAAVDERFGKPDVIAGIATGGIAQGVLVAEELGVPYIYIRPQAKDHGLGNLIEGSVESGQSIILIEDLISTGKSSLLALEIVRDAGCIVKGLVSIFTYGFDVSVQNFKTNNCPVVSLCDYNALIAKAVETNYIKESDIVILDRWRENPAEWMG